jgi:hypothetical protein
MAFTLSKADTISPKTLRNEIVRDLDNQNRQNALIAPQVFPLVELSDSEETYFTMDGGEMPLPRGDLASESIVVDMDDIDESTIDVETFKAKISPEKGADTELNTDQEILNLFEAASDTLRLRLDLARSMVSWRGYGGIDGMIGSEGATAHPDIDASHVFTPATAFSDTANSNPQNTFIDAEFQISNDGDMLDQAGQVTAYMSPSLLRDLKKNDDLESRFSGVDTQGLTEDQVTNILPVQNIQVVRTQVVRTDTNGQPIDGSDNVVDDPGNAVKDNILEPYDASAGNTVRNVVIGAPGQVSAFIPWFADRLAEHGEQAPPGGDFAVDMQNGFLTQMWTENDPLVTWFKIAQEIGFHLHRPDNWAVIQDV